MAGIRAHKGIATSVQACLFARIGLFISLVGDQIYLHSHIERQHWFSNIYCCM